MVHLLYVRLSGMTRICCCRYSPPKLGGVAAPIKKMPRSLLSRAQTGWFPIGTVRALPLGMKNRRLIHNLASSNGRRKELRGNLTPAEAFLWKHLKNSQLNGKKFRRQHSIGPYIVDFFCPECRLAVELDGAGHMTEIGADLDTERSEFLKRFNVTVIRFENKRVFENVEAVLEEIRSNLKRLSLGTTPSAPS